MDKARTLSERTISSLQRRLSVTQPLQSSVESSPALPDLNLPYKPYLDPETVEFAQMEYNRAWVIAASQARRDGIEPPRGMPNIFMPLARDEKHATHDELKLQRSKSLSSLTAHISLKVQRSMSLSSLAAHISARTPKIKETMSSFLLKWIKNKKAAAGSDDEEEAPLIAPETTERAVDMEDTVYREETPVIDLFGEYGRAVFRASNQVGVPVPIQVGLTVTDDSSGEEDDELEDDDEFEDGNEFEDEEGDDDGCEIEHVEDIEDEESDHQYVLQWLRSIL